MRKLGKIEKQTTLKSVIKVLRDYIIDNKLEPGDRLPSELELSDSLGISRNIIREGMRYYRTLGIIESRPKVGAVVARLQPKDAFGGYLPFIEHDPRGISEAAEMRMALECGSAPLMTAKITDEEISKLEKLLNELEGEDVLEAEIEFHTIMLCSTRNRLIESMIPLTVEFFSRKNIDTDNRSRKDIISDHREIIAALQERNPDRLLTALHIHYKSCLND